MSVRAISWALDEVEGLTATQKCILIALADRCNQDHECWPSYTDLIRRTGADRHTISRSIQKFVAKGLVEKRRRFGSSTVYRLCISADMHTTKNDQKQSDISGDMPTISSAQMPTIISAHMPTLTVKESIDTNIYNGQKIKNDHGFDEFWTAYPRKVAKARALTAWRNLNKADRKAAMDALPSWPFSTEQKYIPHAATWLNQRRWEDDNNTTTTEGFVL